MIATYPNAVLRGVAEPVIVGEDWPDEELVDRMLSTMNDANGVGLAAPQIHLNKQIAVVQLPNEEPLVLANPQIVYVSVDSLTKGKEGCLSCPGDEREVLRYEHVVVEYLDADGEPARKGARGMLAVVLQHEIDHLNGVLIIDHDFDWEGGSGER